jgi:hypothetical protein
VWKVEGKVGCVAAHYSDEDRGVVEMFGVEVGRLLRTKWKSAQTLAEELFALFNPDLPLEHNGPIKLTQGTDAPPIQIFMQPGQDATNPITIYRPDPTTGLIPTGPDGQPIGSGVGGTDLGTIAFPPAPGTTSSATPPSGLSPIILYGSVVSGGPGNPFVVDCWARDPGTYTAIGRLNRQRRTDRLGGDGPGRDEGAGHRLPDADPDHRGGLHVSRRLVLTWMSPKRPSRRSRLGAAKFCTA